MGQLKGWNDWMRPIFSEYWSWPHVIVSHLGWNLINAIELIFLLAWSAALRKALYDSFSVPFISSHTLNTFNHVCLICDMLHHNSAI